MKRKLFQTGLIAIIILSFVACKKDEKIDCPTMHSTTSASYRLPLFYFNIVDKTTGEDLFFSNNPKYTKDQLVYFIKTPTSTDNLENDTLPITIDNVRKCLVTESALGNNIGFGQTLDLGFIKVGSLALDTIYFKSAKSNPDEPCSNTYFINSAQFNGQLYIANKNQIITLKK